MVSNKRHKVMKSISSWNLTNNKLHQLFKDNKEFISINVAVILGSQLQDG